MSVLIFGSIATCVTPTLVPGCAIFPCDLLCILLHGNHGLVVSDQSVEKVNKKSETKLPVGRREICPLSAKFAWAS
jgi:hypothetical protein